MGIMKAYREGILKGANQDSSAKNDFLLAEDYVRCVNEHIDAFLAKQANVMRLELEKILQDFPEFWRRIGANGSLSGAVKELEIEHNRTDAGVLRKRGRFLAISRFVWVGLCAFIRREPQMLCGRVRLAGG